ncbi:MAG: NAD+ synthase [Rhodomicrobium sp.]|nr:MAG: NAD+ synthase [Rhodomicrobium sp.]
MTDRLKLALAQLNPIIGDFKGNVALARDAFETAKQHGADLIVYPELFITGYPPEDLVLRRSFQEASDAAIEEMARWTGDGPAIVVGAPVKADEPGETSEDLSRVEGAENSQLYNAALLLADGACQAVRYKVDLPNYGVFDEKRVFTPGPLPGPVNFKGVRIGLPICEDIWTSEVPECLEETGAELLLSIHGSPFRFGKHDIRMNVAVGRVTETGLPLLYVNQVGGQDELVFDGASFALNGDCSLALQMPAFLEQVAFTTVVRGAEGWAFDSGDVAALPDADEAAYLACVMGLKDYVNKNGFKGVVLGLSGGIDSALCAAMAVDALGADRVHCVMLPYRYTSADSLDDAAACAEALGVAYQSVPIEAAVTGVLESLAPLMPSGEGGIWEENIQSRLRGVLLMALSNRDGDMLVTTGNKSEVSVGYATLYGDMNGGYNPIKDLYKTKVYALSRFRNKMVPPGCLGPSGEVIPENIITKAPTAELRENQTDQDSLPPYEILDDILECLVEKELSVKEIEARGHDIEVIVRIEHLLYLAEYKRRQAAPGVKISSRNFGRDRRYPITNKFRDMQ